MLELISGLVVKAFQSLAVLTQYRIVSARRTDKQTHYNSKYTRVA